jgi:hypothetical protein
MRKLIFKKYFNRDLFLASQNIDFEKLVINKKCLKTDLSNYFIKKKHDKYMKNNRKHFNEKMKIKARDRYHNDEEYRKLRIEQIKERRLKVLGKTERRKYVRVKSE